MSVIFSKPPLVEGPTGRGRNPRFLLIGPYDPMGGEYTFLAPPLGVWRLAGVLAEDGYFVSVFDPNCCGGSPEESLRALLLEQHWDVVGVSTTGMTLPHDLALAHLARRSVPHAILVAGGMEATFHSESMFQLCPFDLVVLGEGERPLRELGNRLRLGASLCGLPGTSSPEPDGKLRRLSHSALNHDELRDSIFLTPYERMPYVDYWRRLERSYQIGKLPVKADREARLAEIRSVRLITLNYCPMNCTFCSSTNFLNSAQGGTARIARLEAEECMTMIRRIVNAQPDVRTIIFQDDIFVFKQDNRILPLCEAIVRAKRNGDFPRELQFISTNRVDAMTDERLAAMRGAGFRVLGFGVENFALGILKEFNKAQIYPFIAPVLETTLRLGITPFLDLILTSPRCTLEDLAENIRQAFHWVEAGCELGIYPYVIPFSGAAMAADPGLRLQTVYKQQQVAGTNVSWEQPAKILPLDTAVREAILTIEADFECRIAYLADQVSHLPSRVRSLLWVVCAIPILEQVGCAMPTNEAAMEALLARLPRLNADQLVALQPDAELRCVGHC